MVSESGEKYVLIKHCFLAKTVLNTFQWTLVWEDIRGSMIMNYEMFFGEPKIILLQNFCELPPIPPHPPPLDIIIFKSLHEYKS